MSRSPFDVGVLFPLIEVDERLVREAAHAFRTDPDAKEDFRDEPYYDELDFFRGRSWREIAGDLGNMVSGSQFLMSDAMLYHYLPGFLVGIVCEEYGEAFEFAETLMRVLDPAGEVLARGPEFYRIFTREERAFVLRCFRSFAEGRGDYIDFLEFNESFMESWSQ